MPPERDIDEQIRMHLSVLSYFIENANQRNLQDINIYSEGTCAGLLNLLWSSSLIDLNRETIANYPAVDLFDESRGLFIQVTSDDSLDKIRDTLSKSKKVAEDRGVSIEPKVMLLRFNKPKRKSRFNLNKASDEVPAVYFNNNDIICLNDLAHEIQNLNIAKKRQILNYLIERIPISMTTQTHSVEVYVLRKFFETLSSSNEGLAESSPLSDSELEKKREIYIDFWKKIQNRYRTVLDQQRERSFKAAFDRIGQADRVRLTQYLGIESIKIIDSMTAQDPNAVIEELKSKIIEKIELPLVSETDIVHFLYYEFHHCNVLPIYEELTV